LVEGVNPSRGRVEYLSMRITVRMTYQRKRSKEGWKKIMTSMFLSTIIKYLLLLNLKKEHELKKSLVFLSECLQKLRPRDQRWKHQP